MSDFFGHDLYRRKEHYVYEGKILYIPDREIHFHWIDEVIFPLA